MIYLLRHGETVWNRVRRLQGQQDSPLTLRGTRQAQAVGILLRDLIDDPDDWTMVASPLGRTWQTAVIVAEMLGWDAETIRHEPRLQEVAFGAWEGLTFDEVKRRDPAGFAARQADHWSYRSGGGESYADVADRVGQWLAEQDETAKTVVISHGLAGRVLRGVYAGLSSDEMLALEEEHSALHRLDGGRIGTLYPDSAFIED